MDNLLINLEEEGDWLKKHFTSSVVSINDLLNEIEKLDYKIDELKERIEELTDPEFNKPDAYDIWRDRQ